jgi:hypothetical protein
MKQTCKLIGLVLALGIGASSAYAINSGPLPKDPDNSYKRFKCIQVAQGDPAKIAACKKKFP